MTNRTEGKKIDQKARTMFARHKLGGTSNHVRWLRENPDGVYIAINWKDSPSTNENDYGNDGRSRGYQEVRRMRKVAREEDRSVIVGAYYGSKVPEYQTSMVVGRVEPSADVHIIHCKKGDNPIAYESEAAAREAGVPDECDRDEIEDEWVYKALPLIGCNAYEKPREVSFTDYPLLSAVQPRYHSYCDWHMADEHLKAIDAGLTSFRDVGDEIPDPSDRLAPSQLEVVCNEYLRKYDDYEGYAPTLPVGRTLRDVDIVGETDSKLLFAQVTKETKDSDLQDKADKLGAYEDGGDVRLVLFGPDGKGSDVDLPQGVEYVSVKDVVEFVDEEFSRLIDAMYRLPRPTKL